jgi:hypothetical protein
LIKEHLSIRKETFEVIINNPIFYSSLGKYPQVMDLFKLIGFNKVDKQMNTSFNFVRDPENLETLD